MDSKSWFEYNTIQGWPGNYWLEKVRTNNAQPHTATVSELLSESATLYAEIEPKKEQVNVQKSVIKNYQKDNKLENYEKFSEKEKKQKQKELEELEHLKNVLKELENELEKVQAAVAINRALIYIQKNRKN